MDREEARATIRREWRRIIKDVIPPAKVDVNGETSYVCPFCGHGKHGDGLTFIPTSKDGNTLKCFSCEYTGDIIDLIGSKYGIGYNEALKTCADILNLQIAPTSAAKATQRAQGKGNDKVHSTEQTPLETHESGLVGDTQDYGEYYRECKAHIADPAAASYLKARGISANTAAAAFLGYDPKTRRVIIPCSAGYYVARAIDANQKRYMNIKGASVKHFNSSALYSDDARHGGPVFVTEGAFDALSIIEAGGAAIALNSTSQVNSFLEALEQEPTAATLCICLDKDTAGRKGAEQLKAGLDRLNISNYPADICGSYKDPNETLTTEPALLKANVASVTRAVAKPENVASYIDLYMSREIERYKAAGDKKTGYTNLDEKTGGLYAGLYVIAATSSLGKTTFTHQMADQLAAAGHDVLFFSLEQSRLELVSKSLSRITAQADPRLAVTSLAIRRGNASEAVREAAAAYKRSVADRLSIVEGNFNCNVTFIGDYVRRYVERTGTRPIVIIDYLQILQGLPDKNQSAKEAIDGIVTALKRLSRELDLTVFVISSVNRANYLTPIDFESLKESGGIEFTADVIWGLQLKCLNTPIFDSANKIKEKREAIKTAKAENPRKIQLVCLKNRYGISSFDCFFNYDPEHDTFTPDESAGYSTAKETGRRL